MEENINFKCIFNRKMSIKKMKYFYDILDNFIDLSRLHNQQLLLVTLCLLLSKTYFCTKDLAVWLH